MAEVKEEREEEREEERDEGRDEGRGEGEGGLREGGREEEEGGGGQSEGGGVWGAEVGAEGGGEGGVEGGAEGGGEVGAEGGGEEGAEEGGEEGGEIFFYKILAVKGKKVFHHFLDKFYRYDRKWVKRNGRAYFTCSARGCSARMCATYTSKDSMDDEEPESDLATLTPHHLHLLRDGTQHPIEVQIQSWMRTFLLAGVSNYAFSGWPPAGRGVQGKGEGCNHRRPHPPGGSALRDGAGCD